MQVSKIGDLAGRPFSGKARVLLEELAAKGGVVVAFSGGVDSSLLLAAAGEAVAGRVLAVTSASATHPRRELDNAVSVAALLGAEHRTIRTRELDDPAFTRNPLDRCYHCKRELFGKIKRVAQEESIPHVVEGSTVDDLADFRPGERALREMGIASPLRQADLTKADVRDISRLIGLPTWDRPQAACLASRFPYGTEITLDALRRVERIEDALLAMGFRQVRARYHGDLVRLEIEPDGLESAARPDTRDCIVQAARREGFRFVALDLRGYRTGGFNP